MKIRVLQSEPLNTASCFPDYLKVPNVTAGSKDEPHDRSLALALNMGHEVVEIVRAEVRGHLRVIGAPGLVPGHPGLVSLQGLLADRPQSHPGHIHQVSQLVSFLRGKGIQDGLEGVSHVALPLVVSL